ncbi:MAG: UDP-N-acetylglucosamine--N-acetylmuramyl-(pentapeptide) pyrophosphoryl-undecaprenol N-acetylglucosamine transferase [Spirochaetales bacterium]|jgi:UDP-N-acetylglucosamine--N-acetylmuramyl-(pentapeptide) pyrophosphoryl-undecaprenol N-acetylglucosamine transferase|nr:UDP-N-acetylglucosamine--N-acetylmuramyl-(pentapeptide) pyrophosphoryl-undecaprenol N-acetylglucosamine transferase [Spirochaetales bacterium]
MGKQEIQTKKDLVVFTGGGTGGHVYPGLAVIERLREEWDAEILWIGSRAGMEKGIVESWAKRLGGLEYRGIPSGKLRRCFSLKNFTDVFRIACGFFAALGIFLRRRPALVFSKGGYVSFPPVLAAWLLGAPVITHESDLDPGLATLLNAPFAKKICVPYEESVAHFPARFRKKLVVTGNPVRREIFSGRAEEGLRLTGFSGARPIVLVLGGSLGALEINALTRAALDELLPVCDIIHQTGEGKYEDIPRPGYFAAPYFTAEFPHMLAAASAVVSRAGAGSLWELLAAEKPALLIPLRGAGTRGDQVRNAELFERLGAAQVLSAASLSPEDFAAAVKTLIAASRREVMLRAIRRAAGRDGKDAAALCAAMIADIRERRI